MEGFSSAVLLSEQSRHGGFKPFVSCNTTFVAQFCHENTIYGNYHTFLLECKGYYVSEMLDGYIFDMTLLISARTLIMAEMGPLLVPGAFWGAAQLHQ